ncbi:putative salicylate hydroxylase [Rosellinia necatrix]|uniref:Putative salicylate hydroxylase n=1 Tax=Rosellinia necatrix TaxID=77044 RepID=A0A1S8A554_ROSNE|nr:putative salicylate hydroxylase [Rosellinia necatrix]
MADVKDLRISIIGAGMGGLACALAFAKKGFRRIDVYEAASDLGFVGAGIQLAPNLARVLDRWGCWAAVRAEATAVTSSSIRDGATGRELSLVPMPDIADLYGYPHCVGHRASLAGALYAGCRAEAAAVTFHFSTALERVDSFGTTAADDGGGSGKVRFTAKPRDGAPYAVETDLLLAADGIKSPTRGALLAAVGSGAAVEDTGQAAYRIMLGREQMAGDAEMLALLDSDCALRWIGERRHIVAYPIAGKSVYNLSTCQPDTHFAAAPGATYTTRGDKAAMLGVYGDFCPLVRRMLDLVPEGEVCEWRLRSHAPLERWTLGAAALLGDACHPTLPHLGQGATMAIEDAAVLAECVAALPSVATATADGAVAGTPAALARALRVYEALRRDRTYALVEMAAFSGRTLHLGEGAAREERDRQFAEGRKKGNAVPDKWASPDVQKMIYSHDCVAEAREKFADLFAGLAAPAPVPVPAAVGEKTTNGVTAAL